MCAVRLTNGTCTVLNAPKCSLPKHTVEVSAGMLFWIRQWSCSTSRTQVFILLHVNDDHPCSYLGWIAFRTSILTGAKNAGFSQHSASGSLMKWEPQNTVISWLHHIRQNWWQVGRVRSVTQGWSTWNQFGHWIWWVWQTKKLTRQQLRTAMFAMLQGV